MLNLAEHSSAVRVYHYYRNYWQLQAEQNLVCSPEKDKTYDVAFKLAIIEPEIVIGNLQTENSQVTLTEERDCAI